MHFLNILYKSCTEELVRQTSSRPQEEEVDCEKAEKESGGGGRVDMFVQDM